MHDTKLHVMYNSCSLQFLLSVTLLSSLLPATAKAQVLNDFGFEAWFSAPVVENNTALSNAWAGGLNNVQFGEIDLNRDGLNDLMVFDRHGNKLMPFIFDSEVSYKQRSAQYLYDPSYRKYFPALFHTMQLHDYNNDQLPDIFTYTTGGIMVYKNATQQEIKFEKAVDQFIRSLQGNVYTNLLVTNVDYPAIYDLDSDGDLDILTFWGLGAFMELHKNMSMETYGTADSLLYHKVDFCWGKFAESAESNQLILDTCINISNPLRDIQNDRHTGSTMNVMDINNDDIIDLMLGDVDFMNIQALINEGSGINASMTQVIDSFPLVSPVNLASFPSMQQIDAYNDGIKDLIVSPFDPSLIKSAGLNSVWQYSIGTDDGEITMITESFLQETMIDRGLGAYPVFRDVNNDQLTDLAIGNFGKLESTFYDLNGQLKCNYVASVAYYINNGNSTQPSFELVTDDLGELSQLKTTGLKTDFADLNNDALSDMIVGTGDGKLMIFYKTGTINEVPQFNNPVFINTSNAGTFLTPTVEDVDGDGLKDIISGNRTGRLSYYRNVGSLSSPEYQFITHNYGMVNVTDSSQSYTGYSTPHLFRNKQGKVQLVVGSESGTLFYFPALSSDPFKKIFSKEDVFKNIKEGIRNSVCINDINNDTYPDMVIGNYSGGVNLYKGTLPEPAGIEDNQEIPQLGLFPNPASSEVKIILPGQGKWLVAFYDIYGRIVNSKEVSSGQNVFDVNKMRSGLYIVVASHKNILLSAKLTIIR